MKFTQAFATAALLSCFTSFVARAQEPAAPVPAPAAPAAAATTTAKLKPIKSRFLLTHSTSVWAQPDKTSEEIAHVHVKTHVNVTGVIGDWLQIKLTSGKTGYIPSSAAE